MKESVEANGSAVEISHGDAKTQPGALQEASAIIVPSEAVQLPAWREPVQSRNSMTLLPVDGNVVQNQVVDDGRVKGGVPSSTTNQHVPGNADVLPRQQGSAEDGEALETPNRDRASVALQDRGNGAQHVKGKELEHTADGAVGESSCTIPAATAVLAETPSGSRPFEAVHTHEREEDLAVGRQLADDGRSHSRSTVEGQDRATFESPPPDASKGIADVNIARERLEHSGAHNEEAQDKISPLAKEEVSWCSTTIAVGVHAIDGGPEPSITSAGRNMAEAGVPTIALEVEGVATSQQPPDDAEQGSQLVDDGTEARVACTEEEVVSDTEASRTIVSRKEASTTTPPSPEKTCDGDTPDPTEAGVFFPCRSFTEAKPGFVFKLGDRGLGFYVDGYIDRPTKEKCKTSHPPWNAGPGNDAIRRAPMGPVRKPFKRIPTRGTSEEAKAAEESDTRPFMARMVAQRNSRGFQSTLFKREHILDAHILSLLEKFSDPTFFKKKHGYNVHGQMLGRDGKMIVKVISEKTEEEKAKLSWYRKVYEDRLGKHLPNKRLGDSIEARREAYAYSRHFTAELNEREDELHRGLADALKGQTKLEFITEDYQYPGAYDTDGKVILEKGVPISNALHQTEEQKERACTYRFKAIQRFRAAHDDIIKAVSKKDNALQKVLKKTDPTILLEIAEEAVQSSGMGIYRQKKKASQEVDPAEGRTVQRTDSPEQLREKFAQTLKAQIKGKDKALLKEVAALDEGDAEQMIFNLTKDVEVLPGSWRQDPEALKEIQAHRKHLLVDIEADRRKVFCPWRPGGKHIAHEPWQPFIPRDTRPPVRSSSEGKASTDNANIADTVAQKGVGHGSTRESGSGKEKEGRRPHTAPSYRRKDFIGTISPRARRVLAAQLPGTPLHSAFSTYSTDPFPLEPAHRPNRQSRPVRTEYDAGVVSCARSHTSRSDMPFQMSGSIEQGRQQRAWAEISGSSARAQTVPGGNIKRPHSATTKTPRQACVPPRRPSTAAGAHNPASKQSSGATAVETAAGRGTSPSAGIGQQQEHDSGGKSLDLHVQSGPGVTVLWARLCRPSSDLVYENSAWPSRPRAPDASHRSRRRGGPSRKLATDAASQTQAPPTDAEHEGGMPMRPVNTATVGPGGDREEHAGQSDCKAGDWSLLSNLEGDLLASNWKRVNQRRRVFRGYAERSRMARTWDPGSIFHGEGAGRSHVTGPNISKKDWDGGKARDSTTFPRGFCGPRSSNMQKRRRRNRPSLDEYFPVQMDWNEVDTRRFHDAADEVQEALERRLFPVVTNDETDHLAECFREAQELVDSVGVLLECPENERERFRRLHFPGDLGIGNYAATVSRLKIMWTATCGVVEILGMVRKRKELLEVFCSEEQQSTTESMGPGSFETDEHVQQKLNAPTPNPATISAQERSMFTFEKRLDLAEYAAAIAESLKLWLEIVPWRVQVLYEGKELMPSLGAEEEALPWPPDSRPSPDSEAVLVQARDGVGVTGLGGEQRCEMAYNHGDIDRDKG